MTRFDFIVPEKETREPKRGRFTFSRTSAALSVIAVAVALIGTALSHMQAGFDPAQQIHSNTLAAASLQRPPPGQRHQSPVSTTTASTIAAQSQVLGTSTTLSVTPTQIQNLITQSLQTMLARGLLTGPQGPAGPQGQPSPASSGLVNNGNGQTTAVVGGQPIVSYYPAVAASGFTGTSLAGFGTLSAGTFTSGNSTINGNLNVSGATTLTGDFNATGENTLATTTLSTLTVSGTATFSGSTTIAGLTVTGLNPGLTQGSVAFQGTSALSQDNANFFYDSTNHRLGLGTSTPSQLLTVAGNALVTGNATTSGNQIISGTLSVAGASALATTTILNLQLAASLPISSGGTGASALTAFDLLAGNGTSAVATITPGTVFQVLRSAGTSAYPVYSDIGSLLSAGSNISLTGTSTVAVSSTPSFTTLIVTATSSLATVTATTLSTTGSATFAGNVGIGTINPQYSLDVNGTVQATSVISSLSYGGTASTSVLNINGTLNPSPTGAFVTLSTAPTLVISTFPNTYITPVLDILVSNDNGVTFTNPTTFANPAWTIPGPGGVGTATENGASSIMSYNGSCWLAFERNNGTDGKFGIAKATQAADGSCVTNTWAWLTDVTAITSPIGQTNVWNPRWFVDDDGSIHVIVNAETNCTYDTCFQPVIVDAQNVSLTSWSAPTSITGTFPSDMIDTFTMPPSQTPTGTYIMWFKNETTKYIGYLSSASLKTGWTATHDGTTDWMGLGSSQGPMLYKNTVGGYWRMLYDASGLHYTDSYDNWTTWSSPKVIKSTISSPGTGSIVSYTSGGVAQVNSRGLYTDGPITFNGGGNIIGLPNEIKVDPSGIVFQVEGNIKVGTDDQTHGEVILGDTQSTSTNVGMYRGTLLGAVGGANVLNLAGYDGVNITTGNAGFGSQAVGLTVTNGQNVGINTTTPASRLYVVGAATANVANTSIGFEATDGTARYVIEPAHTQAGFFGSYNAYDVGVGTNNTTQIYLQSESGVNIGSNTTASKFGVNGNASIGSTYSHNNAAPTDGMIIQGVVGIGTATPSTGLTVQVANNNNGLTVTNGVAELAMRPATSTAQFIGATNAYDTALGTNNTATLYMQNSPRTVTVANGNTVGASTFNINGNAAIGDATWIGTGAPTNGMIIKGNVGIGTTTPTLGPLTMASGAYVTAGGTWTNASDRNLKENFASVSPATMLQDIDELPVTEWDYKTEGPSVKHIGPVAQDFWNIFHIGNASTSISTIDPSGVALLGIQALDQKITALQGSLTGNATATNLSVYTPSNFSGDSVGEAEILAGQTSVRITFAQAYQYQPIVTADILNAFMAHNISDITAAGFSINIPAATTTALTFDWHSFASPDEQLSVSDGTTQAISLVVESAPPPSAPQVDEGTAAPADPVTTATSSSTSTPITEVASSTPSTDTPVESDEPAGPSDDSSTPAATDIITAMPLRLPSPGADASATSTP